jgi:isopenicillin N synthase-like dioxygenase
MTLPSKNVDRDTASCRVLPVIDISRLSSPILATSRALFDLPGADKAAIDISRSPANRGYEPLRGQTLEPGGEPDLKEGCYIGAQGALGGFNQGANQWPGALPDSPRIMMTSHAALTRMAQRLMGGLALSLCLPEDAFAGFCRDPIVTPRLLHYPPQPASSESERGAGAHTDFGGLIARWTNDRYRSTPHRVVNRSGQERYSIPFFILGRAGLRRGLPCRLSGAGRSRQICADDGGRPPSRALSADLWPLTVTGRSAV